MCPWLLLLLVLSVMAIPPEPKSEPLTYHNFVIPLANAFMPLCGNGRIDSIADYESYFNRSDHIRLMVPTARLSDDATGVTEVQLGMAEVCDDGNRLDGDGCSADCLYFDSLVSACDIALPSELTAIEDFVFFGDKAVVATKDALYEVSGGLAKATLLAPKSVTVHAMLPFRGELWVFAESAVYVVHAGLLERNFTVTTSDDGYLLEQGGKLYLVCKDTSHIWLWDVAAKELVSSLSGNAPPVIAYMLVNSVLVVLMEGNLKALVSLGEGAVTFTPNEQSMADYWQTASNACFTPFINIETSIRNVSLKYIPLTVSSLQGNIGFKSRMLSPVIYAEAMTGPRWLLNVSESKDARVLYFGANGFDTCIDYSVLKGGLIKQSPTYLETLTSAVNYSTSELWPSQFAALAATLKQKIKRVKRLIENPTTKSLWVLQGGVLKDISRRGVQVDLNGHCVPTCAGLCPACHWSPDCGACVPCPRFAPRFSEALEWQLQCQPCVTATGLARRRLLIAGSDNFIAFAVMGSQAEVEAAFLGCTATPRDGRFVDVEVPATADPQAAMRSVNLRLQAFQIVTRPRLVLHLDSGASPQHAITAALIISLLVALSYVL